MSHVLLVAINPNDYEAEDEEDMYDTLRRNLVSLGSFVAVRTDEKALHPYWLYEGTAVEESYFTGHYLDPIKGNRLMVKKTKTKEDVDYCCVFSADVQLQIPGIGKKNVYTMEKELDAERCHYS